MIEYMPWSQEVADKCLRDYEKGIFSILDIELGGQCNYHCIYCDSPCREKVCDVSYDNLERAFLTGNIRWVFICGLGEPTATGNKIVLLHILQLCERYNARCSIFTNLSNLSTELIEYIDKGILYLLFKYDSRDIVKNMNLYGVSYVNKQLFNIDRIKKHVIIKNGCTNLAASIVPTKVNKEDILDIVRDCLSNNIYPLIAELENSGDAQDYYSQLALSDEELLHIKEQVNELVGETYKVPVCPAVISGVHVRHDGRVTVDEYTGLSCHWFWLQEPKTKVVGDFNEMTVEEIVTRIDSIRADRFAKVQSLQKDAKNKVFGGCGGDVNVLLHQYITSALRRK